MHPWLQVQTCKHVPRWQKRLNSHYHNFVRGVKERVAWTFPGRNEVDGSVTDGVSGEEKGGAGSLKLQQVRTIELKFFALTTGDRETKKGQPYLGANFISN